MTVRAQPLESASSTVPDVLIVRTVRALHSGLRRGTPNLDPGDTPTHAGQLPIREEALVERVANFGSRAVEASHASEHQRARKFLDAARNLVNPDEIGREATCAVRQYVKAQEGLIRYKLGDIDAARDCIREAIRWLNELKDDHGWDERIDSRRVHCARNLCKLDAVDGDADEAARAGFGLLRYVTGKKEAWPYADVAADRTGTPMQDHKRAFLYNQVARELAMLFTHGDNPARDRVLDRGQSLFVEKSPNVSRSRGLADETERIKCTSDWLECKTCLHARNYSSFLGSAERFFERSPAVPAFWLDIARNLCQICARKESACAKSVRQKIEDIAGEEALNRLHHGAS